MAVDASMATPRGRRTTRRTSGWAVLAGVAVLVASALGGVSSATADAVVPPAIPVGDGPLAVAFFPDGTKAYVANNIDNSVTVISVDVAPSITSASPTAGTAGTPYSFTVTATNTIGDDSQAYTLIVALAATGVDDPMPFVLIAGGLLFAGVIALILRGLLRRRSRSGDR